LSKRLQKANIKNDWLWDRNISLRMSKAILKDAKHAHFLSLASLLLSRKNSPKEVFNVYLKPAIFVNNWNAIKRQMRKNAWNDPRIEFWQAIYEKLREKHKAKGLLIPKNNFALRPENEFCKLVADKIKAVRVQNGLTQNKLAKRLKISQQVISRIESGRENISLLTLKKITDSLDAKLSFEIY